MLLTISQELAVAIVTYLKTKPYEEVVGFITEIVRLKPTPLPEDKKE
jgi:hypothetical protein